VTERWRVLRVDENGNTYVVGERATEAEARDLAARLEARGHAQTYYVERVAAPDRG